MSRRSSTFGSEVSKVFRTAVSSAQNQNRRKGLPNVFMQNGRMCMELPDGRTMRASKQSLASALKSRNASAHKGTVTGKAAGASIKTSAKRKTA